MRLREPRRALHPHSMRADGANEMKQTDDISWTVPFLDHLPEAKRLLWTVFSPIALIRIFGITTLVALIAVAAVRHHFPDLEIDWARVLLKCLGLVVLYFAMPCLIVLAPPSVTVTSRGILVSYGQARRLHVFADLAECRILENKGKLPVLTFRRRSDAEVRKFVIPPSVSIAELAEMIEKGV